ncbi:hypothetical protein AB4Z52_35065 [Rhizobium sp. 2YAF20]|uniref:hypothetical protein n=1 Tax=Rhizobium sp. 2YAF20 TaxID=3233027 RepID=UPI003F97C50D
MDDLDVKVDGSITLDRDLRFYGLISGSLTVPKGRRIELHGTVNHDLIVEAGATALIYGSVGGTLINRGGDVSVWGTVGAVSDYDQAKPSVILPQAIIKRRPEDLANSTEPRRTVNTRLDQPASS